jgi:hypothetical protein
MCYLLITACHVICVKWENLKERIHLEDACVDGMMILKQFLKKIGYGVDRINLHNERLKWMDLANKKLMVRVPQNARNYFIS